MCSMYEGMRNSSRGKIIVGKDIVNVRWGSSVTSVENANVQQPTAPQGVVEEADDGITLMDLFKIIRKHLVTAIIAFVVVVAGVSAYTFLAPAKYTATAQTMATYNASDGGESIAPAVHWWQLHFQPNHLISDACHHFEGAQAGY